MVWLVCVAGAGPWLGAMAGGGAGPLCEWSCDDVTLPRFIGASVLTFSSYSVPSCLFALHLKHTHNRR